uniref:Uncharacterized protein n=1 Tax=Pyrodinium bahamense TaxID=73915 RepID=A0A6T8XIG1_9DINO|mmetsp:Transcript_36909/g.102474  ORF Transcript_36909/g.102474 Transcript_36909/m.102474 type:complete len:201 (+) Transcript_36909:86-688(+)
MAFTSAAAPLEVVQVARRRTIIRAALALLCVGALKLGPRSAAFSPGSAILERPLVALGRQAREHQFLAASGASEPEVETSRHEASALGIDQNPPWATCFVEEQQATRSVLEEWVLRGEHSQLAAFRAWRQRGADPTSVRCVELPEEEALRTVCLECVSPSGISTAALGAHGATAFGAFSQCMAQTAMGLGFCKSGQVTLA